ncbi:MAG: hypothetical protein HKP58_08330 [Desulfatitalea sp.]|nr:hypothetical protein [Desulfatitalea sp.]NNK00407.1 hypothetical protein [Desulfatitalea sp.]
MMLLYCLVSAGGIGWLGGRPNTAWAQERGKPAEEVIKVTRIAPAEQGGQAYRLVYTVSAALPVYWRFKTDFNNDFLVENKFIQAHRVISRQGNTVITENKYTNRPTASFRWQTVVVPEIYRIEFKLLNPEACHHTFHYGNIQLEAVAGGTRVTQIAYFDFAGATLWAIYPWRGGMRDFLTYTARWEQETIQRLKARYVR